MFVFFNSNLTLQNENENIKHGVSYDTDENTVSLYATYLTKSFLIMYNDSTSSARIPLYLKHDKVIYNYE